MHVVVLQCRPTALLPFSFTSPSSLLKLAITRVNYIFCLNRLPLSFRTYAREYDEIWKKQFSSALWLDLHWENKGRWLSIQPKLSKIWKLRQMVQKFLGKVSRNSGNFWISEIRTIQPKILELSGTKLNGKKPSGKNVSKIWVYLARLSSFWKFWKMLCHSLLEVAENSYQMFWLNGKGP